MVQCQLNEHDEHDEHEEKQPDSDKHWPQLQDTQANYGFRALVP